MAERRVYSGFMRIRWKLLIILLLLILPPLWAVRWYSAREARMTGAGIAWDQAQTLTQIADRELLQTADMYAEALSDAAGLLETSLKILAKETAESLADPARETRPVFYARDFVAGKAIPGLKPLAPPDEEAGGFGQPGQEDAKSAPPSPLFISFDVPAFFIAPGADEAQGARDAQRLYLTVPLLKLLFQERQNRILWAYVSLADGTHMTYPGHGGFPPDYDPRSRPWYTDALRLDGLSWRIMVDAVTLRVAANLSMPIRGENGALLGVAGIDAPLGTLLPDNDPTLRWTRDMRAVLGKTVSLPDGKWGLDVIAGHDQTGGKDWRKPLKPERIIPPEGEAAARMFADLAAHKAGVVRLPYKGKPSSWAYQPMGRGDGVLLLIVPHEAVTAEAVAAERRIIDRTAEMVKITGLFTVAAVLLVIVAAFLGSRAIVAPLRRLSLAAERVAAGDLTARVPVKGRDELADLGRAFNDMTPKLEERLRLKNDLALAMEVQQLLLPMRPPSLPGLDIAGATFFCDETGGDYFDYLAFAGDACHTDVIVGDVTGHGISAALFMATGRALMRARACDAPDPGDLLTRVNALLCDDTFESGRFITLFLLRLENGGLSPGGRLRWCRAGHDPGIVYDSGKDVFTELMGPGIPLGVEPSWRFEESTGPGLSPGMVLAIGTDGIWEAHDARGDMFGRERFREVLRANAGRSSQEIVEATVAAVRAFQGDIPREDDITLVIIKALP